MNCLRPLVAFALLGLIVAGCQKEPDDFVQGYVEGEFVYVSSPLGGTLQQLFVRRGDEGRVPIEAELFFETSFGLNIALFQCLAVNPPDVATLRLGVREVGVDRRQERIVGERDRAVAAAGEVLVSGTTHELVADSDFSFEDRGMHEPAAYAETPPRCSAPVRR